MPIKLSSSRKTKRVLSPNQKNGPKVEDFKVKDLSLAEYGRKAIDISEHEMPGLMSIRRKYAQAKPLQGVRITGSLPKQAFPFSLGKANPWRSIGTALFAPWIMPAKARNSWWTMGEMPPS